MQIVSLIWGILSLVGFIVGLIPCVGWWNWINIPFAGLGLIFCIIALATAKPGESRTGSITGLILCGIAVIVGVIRLILGGGVV